MPSLSFDRVADAYDASRGYPPAVADAIGAALFEAAGGQPGSQILEIGIGTGRIAIPLLAYGAHVTGIDISPRMMGRLRATLPERQAIQPDRPWGQLTLQLGDMTALPYAAASFDAVIAVHVLHLVSEWERALDEALRVLRPQGALLIGQDLHPAGTAHEIQTEWRTIIRATGVLVDPVGARNHYAILAALRGRGLVVEQSVPVSWTAHVAPREELDYVANRVWSRTWHVPDDIFAASIERLTTWARQEYADALNVPREEPVEFLLTRCTRPA